MEKLVADCPVSARVVDTVDGRAFDEQARRSVVPPPLHAPPSPFAPNAGEIGCFLSHRAVWQTIAASDLDAGLVFEDDVEIDPVMFEPSLDLALAQIHAHGVIQFQVRDIADPGMEMA